ncbi:MAG TPA: hypothetical protein VMF03_17705 [Steroidobacteraceae bacterium]|nr:hypothetical protein [Steroidobacteraceae bacterium]
MEEALSAWDFGATVTAPCADIFSTVLPERRLSVLMKFSLVVGGIPRDLELIFERAIAVSHQDEVVHSVSSKWPKPIPKIGGGEWERWTYPFLKIDGSRWLAGFSYLPLARGLIHVALVSMNDIVEVIGSPTPKFQWIPSNQV